MRKSLIVLLLSTVITAASAASQWGGAVAYANNLAITDVNVGAPDASTVPVSFKITWENSWRTDSGAPNNYDAAWVFIKYSTDSGATWAHATLKATTSSPLNDGLGYSAGSGTSVEIKVPVNSPAQSGDKKGAFIQRSANGSGTLTATGVTFIWDWSSDKLSENSGTAITAAKINDPSLLKVIVMGIEMVYVPTGAFYIGSGGSETSAFYTYPTTTNPFSVSSEAAISVGTTNGYLYYANSTNGGDRSGPIPAAYPKGYAAFYVMKYKLSQQQYVDFFNTLTSTQKTNRDITGGVLNSTGKASDSVINRNTISWSSGNATTGANLYVSCNFLSWADSAAYTDWAGLRPMTELEYEKTSRGTAATVANEYVWGSTSYTQVTGITSSGAVNETAANGGNLVIGNHASVQGPMRCGFSATSSTTRAQAGASYYGVMELSGNLWGRQVTAGSTTGRAFTGLHGDGALDSNGNADVINWPGTDAVGLSVRSGGWDSDASNARVSDRSYGTYTTSVRYYTWGARCARTAP